MNILIHRSSSDESIVVAPPTPQPVETHLDPIETVASAQLKTAIPIRSSREERFLEERPLKVSRNDNSRYPLFAALVDLDSAQLLTGKSDVTDAALHLCRLAAQAPTHSQENPLGKALPLFTFRFIEKNASKFSPIFLERLFFTVLAEVAPQITAGLIELHIPPFGIHAQQESWSQFLIKLLELPNYIGRFSPRLVASLLVRFADQPGDRSLAYQFCETYLVPLPLLPKVIINALKKVCAKDFDLFIKSSVWASNGKMGFSGAKGFAKWLIEVLLVCDQEQLYTLATKINSTQDLENVCIFVAQNLAEEVGDPATPFRGKKCLIALYLLVELVQKNIGWYETIGPLIPAACKFDRLATYRLLEALLRVQDGNDSTLLSQKIREFLLEIQDEEALEDVVHLLLDLFYTEHPAAYLQLIKDLKAEIELPEDGVLEFGTVCVCARLLLHLFEEGDPTALGQLAQVLPHAVLKDTIWAFEFCLALDPAKTNPSMEPILTNCLQKIDELEHDPYPWKEWLQGLMLNRK